MIPVAVMEQKRVAVFGLGGSGLATAAALVAGGADILAWDDNPVSVQRARDAGLAVGDLRAADWSGFDALVLAPGVPLTHPEPHWSVKLAMAHEVEIIGDVELFMRQHRADCPHVPVIAITGTNGKSTTTALTAHLMAEAGYTVAMGGNIGKAVLTLEPPTTGSVVVLEVSSYQIDLAPSLKPDVGILLNLAPDHLERHGDMAHYASVKERMVTGLDAKSLAVIGIDDDYSYAIADRVEQAGGAVARVTVQTAVADGYQSSDETLQVVDGGAADDLASLEGIATLRGRHNAQNALAALAACHHLGVARDVLQQGLRSFPGLAHRMELLGALGGTLYVNDSKATNADAAQHALAAYEGIYWILGGLAKTDGIDALAPYFGRVRHAFLIGDAAARFGDTLGDQVSTTVSGTIEQAVIDAHAMSAGDGPGVVLLSPAAASFDQFANFELRGEAFRQAVLALQGFCPLGTEDKRGERA